MADENKNKGMEDGIVKNKEGIDQVQDIDLEKSMRDYYIDYAMSVIVARALPDARDGMKPVQRRILYSMGELGVTPDKPYRKSARIVGDTMGKYHPHGDSSIYDAMARMAQDFNMRYMLVDGHGNFGSPDGDEPAAMRYTEARLSKLSLEMLADINKDTVDFVPNFDESLKEPTVLPARFPNMLVNGANGIAVGMATNIPPHNLGEIIDGVTCMIDNYNLENRETTVEELMEIIKGPDFPTGATIYGTRGIEDAYRTGKGRIVVRANTEIEPMHNGRQRIVVTEIPYQVNKARLVERIADLVKEKRVEGISDLRDETNREGTRVVIELKRDANARVILNQLYKNTPLQETFSVNMLALVNNEPKVLNLKQALKVYLNHQKDVVRRRTVYDLDKAKARAHILEGLLVALDHIDEIVSIIRSSKNVQEAKERLISRFELTEPQAQAIVDMRLRALTGLERDRLEGEYADLEQKIAEYTAILGSDKLLLNVIKEELLIIKTKFADRRRTYITYDEGEIEIEDLIKNEQVVITMTNLGYIKRTSLDMYRSQNRGGRGIKGLETRDEDFVTNLFVGSTHDYIQFFTNKGKVYRMRVYEIQDGGRTAKGQAIVNLLSLTGNEKVSAAILVPELSDDSGYLFMATRQGLVKKTRVSEFANIRVNGLIALTLQDKDELIDVRKTDGNQDIMIATREGQMIRFNEADVRPTGRTSMGVKGIELEKKDYVIGMQMTAEGTDMLAVTESGMGKRTQIEEFGVQHRGGKGVRYYKLTPKTGSVVGFKVVNDQQELLLITSEGIIIRLRVSDVSRIGRVTSGVKLVSLKTGVQVVRLAMIQEENGETNS